MEKRSQAIWAALGVFVAVPGSVLAAYQLFFNEEKEPSVPPPVMSEERSCRAGWVYVERQACEDRTMPIYRTVVDARICGTTKRVVEERPQGFKACRDPSHGIERYQQSDVVVQSSGWLSGGRDPQWWCQAVKNAYQSTKGVPVVWSGQSTREESRRDWKGHVTYKYHCTVTAQWSPIYKVAESPSCGRKDVVRREIVEPKQCQDTTSPVGFRTSVNANCEWGTDLTYAGPNRTRAIYEGYLAGLVKPEPVCLSCDEFHANAQQQAECILANLARDLPASARANATGEMQRMLSMLIDSDRPMDSAVRDRARRATDAE